MPSRSESPASHHHARHTAVVLCNLGTPDAPTPAAVRRYLREFLSDPRVVETPPILWKPLLHGVILPFRAGASAAKYQAIWGKDDSPLRRWMHHQALLLKGWLGEHGLPHVLVTEAMRYGKPALHARLDRLAAQGVQRMLVLPAYPQYAACTVGSVFDSVCQWSQRTRHVPELRFVNQYATHPLYIEALAANIRTHWMTQGRGDKLVMSFHGVPARCVAQGDPYREQCQATAEMLAQRLGLAAEQWMLTFQSRFGKARWLQPYTQPTIERLARQGVRSVDVVCPGFTVDCLETLEEINMEVRRAFLAAGGEEYHYIACLNDHTQWIEALGHIALQHLAGWIEPATSQAQPEGKAAWKWY